MADRELRVADRDDVHDERRALRVDPGRRVDDRRLFGGIADRVRPVGEWRDAHRHRPRELHHHHLDDDHDVDHQHDGRRDDHDHGGNDIDDHQLHKLAFVHNRARDLLDLGTSDERTTDDERRRIVNDNRRRAAVDLRRALDYYLGPDIAAAIDDVEHATRRLDAILRGVRPG